MTNRNQASRGLVSAFVGLRRPLVFRVKLRTTLFMLKTLSEEEIRDRLKRELDEHPDGAVVFDADGTLWSHDVGCMVFDHAVDHGVFSAEAREPLLAEAQKQGIDFHESWDANQLARAMQQAWYGGNYPEREAAEMQVWAYVGMSESDFRSLVQDALKAGCHESTLHTPVLSLASWAREQGATTFVVSASPLWVVEEATRGLAFDPEQIAAGVPNTTGNEAEGKAIAPQMESPLPYGPDKVSAGRKLLAGRTWLAALGDSSFDVDMMKESRLALGLGKKESMLRRLAELPHGYRWQF